MSKQDQTEKKAARAASAPEQQSSEQQLSEEQLEKVAGGVRIRFSDVLVTS